MEYAAVYHFCALSFNLCTLNITIFKFVIFCFFCDMKGESLVIFRHIFEIIFSERTGYAVSQEVFWRLSSLKWRYKIHLILVRCGLAMSLYADPLAPR